MDIEKYLAGNPSVEDVVYVLCRIANHHIFAPPWNANCWKELSEYANLTKNDFWEDADALSPVDYLYGQTAWKYKTD